MLRPASLILVLQLSNHPKFKILNVSTVLVTLDNNLLLAILTVGASDFRGSFGAGTNFNIWILVATIISMLASLVVRYYFMQNKLSLLIVAIPILLLLLMYVFKKRNRVGE